MASNKKLKKAIRARMASTGESYTVCRRAVMLEIAGALEGPDGRLFIPPAQATNEIVQMKNEERGS